MVGSDGVTDSFAALVTVPHVAWGFDSFKVAATCLAGGFSCAAPSPVS